MAKKKEEKAGAEMNCFQALNHFRLNGRNRRIAAKRHSGLQMAEIEWEETLRGDKLIK